MPMKIQALKSIKPGDGYTLFLDRDGVINHEKEDDYIHTWDEFVFYDAVPDAIKIFSGKFDRVLVVTNQRGVGKGVTKLEDLVNIHCNMLKEVEKAGGKIERVYFCTDIDNSSPNRKPNPGMGLQAERDYPDIDFKKAVMVGNTLSDMGFGRKLGMYTVFLTSTRPATDLHDPSIDTHYPSLIAFAEDIS